LTLAGLGAAGAAAGVGALYLATRGTSIAEPHDLTAFHQDMLPIPGRVEAAITRGLIHDADLPFAQAWRLLEPEGDGIEDGVVRNRDGMLVVCCRTEMPGVSPEMWDWWMGWHGVSTERYKLWHPKDHVWSSMAEDRSRYRDVRSRYVGNDSYVDEYIGPDLQKLTISFRTPDSFGLDPKRVDQLGTAICARTGLRNSPLNVGRLVHLVRRTEKGAEMLSRFWLADVEIDLPLIGGVALSSLNTTERRAEAVPEQFGFYLLRHCAAEMNHLARILPALHAKFGST
jgi:hypothetical protein